MRRRQMAGQLATALVTIAAIIGIVAFAVAIREPWLAPVLVGAALLYVGYRQLWPPTKKYLQRFTRYPVLASQLEDMVKRVVQLEERLVHRPSLVARAVQEGRLQVFGALLAARVNPTPTIMSMTIRDARIRMAAQRAKTTIVPVGARFSLAVIGVGEVKGVLSVVEVDNASTSLVLECVEEVVPAYWEHLRTEAARNSAPPGGVELLRYQVGGLPGLDDLPTILTPPTAARRNKNAH